MREGTGQRRQWYTQGDLRFGAGGATSNAWRLDLESTKQCVEDPGSIVMDRSDLVAVRTDPTRRRDLLDLVTKDRLLQMPKHGFRIFEQQPEALGLSPSKWPRQASQTLRLRGSILKSRLDDDPHIHGNSLAVKPTSQTKTHSFCPLTIGTSKTIYLTARRRNNDTVGSFFRRSRNRDIFAATRISNGCWAHGGRWRNPSRKNNHGLR